LPSDFGDVLANLATISRVWTNGCTGGSSIIGGISPFQVCIIHIDTFLKYFPRPCVPAPSSRSKNSAPERQFSASLFSIKTRSNRVIKTALSSVRHVLKHTRTPAQSLHFFLERWALQVAHYPGKRDMTELHPATPHIDGISPFQVYRIYQETLLQYFTRPLDSFHLHQQW
jgi:hypothetical protein